jgi:hypothetical protein
MHLDLEAPVLALEAGDVITLDDAEGLRIHARSGTVWVTEEGDLDDHIVDSGDALIVARPGRTVVQAMAPSCIALRPTLAPANDDVQDRFDSDAYLAEVRNRVYHRYY